MKKAVILLIIIAVGTSLPAFSALAQPDHIPHEYPSARTGLLDEIELLRSYNLVSDLTTSGHYGDARKVLQELASIELPGNLQNIIDKYNQLSDRLVNAIEDIDLRLDEVSALLNDNSIDKARIQLSSIRTLIHQAYYLLEDLTTATDTLMKEVRNLTASSDTIDLYAYYLIDDSNEKYKFILDRFYQLQREFSRRHTRISGLFPTELSLTVTPGLSYVGDTIMATGRLTSEGLPLADKDLVLEIGNTTSDINTDKNGGFLVYTTLPYDYVSTTRITAIYEPAGDDAYTYAPGESNPVIVETRFHYTHAEISIPEEVYKGISFNISGKINTEKGAEKRTVRVLMDNTVLAEKTVSEDFTTAVNLPESTSAGEHRVLVSVEPAGKYAGTEFSRVVTVSPPPVFSDIRIPACVLLPNTIRVSGIIYNGLGPISDSAIHINVNDASVATRTSRDGDFSDKIRLNALPSSPPAEDTPPNSGRKRLAYNLYPIALQNVEIQIESPAVQTGMVTVTKHFVTVNPVTISPLLIIFIVLVLLIYKRSRVPALPESLAVRVQSAELPVMETQDKLHYRFEFTGSRQRILSAYGNGLRVIEEITGVTMTPNLTLREYLELLSLPQPAAVQFSELTALAETALYAENDPPEDNVALAEQYGNDIREALRRGNP